jgi:cytochrome c553
MKSFVFLFLLSALFISCNNFKNNEYSAFQKKIKDEKHPGKKLMETYCYACHSPSASKTQRIAPPMVAIKKHYINDDTSKEQFILAMQNWIKNPNEDDAKMFGAVKRFGVMPKTPYPENTIKQIADYMFDYDIEQPEWFEDHFNKEKSKSNGMGFRKEQGIHTPQEQTNYENLPYAERGLKYALTTKAVLGKNLMGTMQKKGVIEAITFCNEKAYPLTDSVALANHATIKRVSEKPRNPNNNANSEELEYIKTFKSIIANNEDPNPIVKELENKIQVFYPITTNAMCLQCHGKPDEDIQKPTLKKIVNLYPKDKAIGYGINEVRGIWSITFNK